MSINVFIYEYITGGGLVDTNLPISLACEGAAMILSLIKGLKNPNFNIQIFLDYRFTEYI